MLLIIVLQYRCLFQGCCCFLFSNLDVFEVQRFHRIIFHKTQVESVLNYRAYDVSSQLLNMPPRVAINNCSCPFTKHMD